MTNEEAIIQLEYRKDFATPMQIKAIDMGIEALKTLNATSNGELIKALFNVVEVKPHKEFTHLMSSPVEKIHHLDITIEHENIRSSYLVPKKWWNAPYRRGND